ncbi:MAG: hypothetical protein SPK09_08210 [Porphyromonas sp.]|nr:hypothetical protein [Porphyromonas sp.]
MKKLIQLLLLCLFCGLGLLAQGKQAQEPRLLGIPLGITKTEFEKRLKAIAPRAIYSEERGAYINTPSVSGAKTSGFVVHYVRNKTALYMVIFEKEASEDRLLSSYSRLKNLHTQKYGEPDEENEVYDSKYLYNESDAKKSRAIASGSGQVVAYWNVGKTSIGILALRGRSRMSMTYSDRDLM